VPPPDVALVARGGHEVPAHGTVLAAQSSRLCQLLVAGGQRIEVQHPVRVVQAFVRFLYMEGAAAFDGLAPKEALDLLKLGKEFEVDALQAEHVEALIHPPPPPLRSKRGRLRLEEAEKAMPPGQKSLPGQSVSPKDENAAKGLAGGPTICDSVEALLHDHMEDHPKLLAGVCSNVGRHFLEALDVARPQLLALPQPTLLTLLKIAVCHVFTAQDAKRVIQFCMEYAKVESMCELLSETKRWPWGDGATSEIRGSLEEGHGMTEWDVHGVRAMLESSEGAPPKYVDGQLFDWGFRLDWGASEQLRIVYEGAVPDEEDEANDAPRGRTPLAYRFPAATFAWRVFHGGQEVFHEKPIFICFPVNVPIHWSTNLPLKMADLDAKDNVRISVGVMENPMLSLILAHFSADIRGALASEDIFNSLPHIEYRCISSYMMVGPEGGPEAAHGATQPA